jgi:hypothetical protein
MVQNPYGEKYSFCQPIEVKWKLSPVSLFEATPATVEKL